MGSIDIVIVFIICQKSSNSLTPVSGLLIMRKFQFFSLGGVVVVVM